MKRRVSSRGDIDKWSKLAETSKHWQVFWWPRIRSRDSASFFLVTAMPCIILQISGVVSDMLYTTWGFPIWNKYHMGHWHGSAIYVSLTPTQSDRLGPSPYLKTAFRNQFPNCSQLWYKCRLIVVFQILDIIILTVATVACFCIIDIAWPVRLWNRCVSIIDINRTHQ